MALNWQPAPIPSGETFTDTLPAVRVPLEAPALAQRLNPTSVNGDITIGVSFDLSQYGAILANLNLANATDLYLNPGHSLLR